MFQCEKHRMSNERRQYIQLYYQLMHLMIKNIHSSHLKPHTLKMSVMPN
jgi:hypothetical protein